MDIRFIDIEISVKKPVEENELTGNTTLFSRKFRIDADFTWEMMDDHFFQFIHNMVDKILLELKRYMEVS